MSPTPQPWLEELVAWATQGDDTADLVEAKAAYFSATGEVYDDEPALEPRMSSFLEHYVCDRVSPRLGHTWAQARYRKALVEEPPERAMAWRALTTTRHGLFQVKAVEPGLLRVRDVFSREVLEVMERRKLLGVNRGDVMECRVVPFGGQLHFSNAWVFHPAAAAPLIVARAAQVALEGPDARRAFVADCAQRALKVDRYRQFAVERIYAFSSPAPRVS